MEEWGKRRELAEWKALGARAHNAGAMVPDLEQPEVRHVLGRF